MHVAMVVLGFVFTTEVRLPRLHIPKVILNCGVVQTYALTVDPITSLEKNAVPSDSSGASRVDPEGRGGVADLHQGRLSGLRCCSCGMQGGCRCWYPLGVHWKF
ncbi:hypothetical protein ABZP36_027586 [Zizania latifolia]